MKPSNSIAPARRQPNPKGSLRRLARRSADKSGARTAEWSGRSGVGGVQPGRPPIERRVSIARALRTGQTLNMRMLAEKLEVNRRTIGRDLEFLRDRLRYEFEWVELDLSFRLVTAPEPML